MPDPIPGKPPSPTEVTSKLTGKLKGIPAWGWVAAAGVFILVLSYYARKNTAVETPIESPDEAALNESEYGLTYDEAALRSAPINYEGNLFGVNGYGSSTQAVPTYYLGKNAKLDLSQQQSYKGEYAGATITIPATGGGPPNTPSADLHGLPFPTVPPSTSKDNKKKKKK